MTSKEKIWFSIGSITFSLFLAFNLGIVNITVPGDVEASTPEEGAPVPQSSPAFIHIADTHINLNNTQVIELFRQVIQEVNSIRPDFVVFGGDLVDWSYGPNWEIYDNLIQGCEVPVYSVIGNHDYRDSPWDLILEPGAERFEKFNHDRAVDLMLGQRASDLKYYRDRLLPKNPGFNHGPVLGDFSFDHGPIHVVCLNSGHDAWAIPSFCIPEGSGLTDAQMAWLRNDLAGKENIYIFMHHPVFNRPGARSCSLPVPASSSIDGCIGYNREEFIELCNEYNVIAVLSGHLHRNDDYRHDGTHFYVTSTPPTYRIINHGAEPLSTLVHAETEAFDLLLYLEDFLVAPALLLWSVFHA